MKTPLLVIAGPTASGKTSLSLKCAKEYNGEIISADSMQIYKTMDIGTAKLTEEEMEGIKHHLIDFLDVSENFSSAQFKESADGIIEDIHIREKLPIICGGTGLYINSVINDYKYIEMNEDPEYREYLNNVYNQYGKDYLYDILKSVDIKSCEKIHKNNVKRVMRALEVYHNTGIKFSETENNFGNNDKYDLVYFAIGFKDRELLYSRINQRVDIMIKEGLLEEAFSLYVKREELSKTAAQAIGYKELFLYFDNILSKEEAIEKLKQETRKYAKRQLTWFKKDERINWIFADGLNSDEIFQKCRKVIENTSISCYNHSIKV